jgi:hypothetical protein
LETQLAASRETAVTLMEAVIAELDRGTEGEESRQRLGRKVAKRDPQASQLPV